MGRGGSHRTDLLHLPLRLMSYDLHTVRLKAISFRLVLSEKTACSSTQKITPKERT